MKKLFLAITFLILGGGQTAIAQVAQSRVLNDIGTGYQHKQSVTLRATSDDSKPESLINKVRASRDNCQQPVARSSFFSQANASVTDGDNSVFAYCSWSADASKVPSFWRVTDTSAEFAVKIDADASLFFPGGFLKDGLMYGYVNQMWLGLIYSVYWMEMDFETGYIQRINELDLAQAPRLSAMAYAADEGVMYGLGEVQDHGLDLLFMKMNPDEPGKPTIIATLDRDVYYPTSFCYNKDEGVFYAINNHRQVVRISKDGEAEVLYTLDLDNKPTYICGLYYNSRTKQYLWSPNWDDKSAMATIDMGSGEVNILYYIPGGEQFEFFISPNDDTVDPLKPSKPRVKDISFPNGATSGTITYQLPETSEDGTILTGTLACHALLDGNEYKVLSGQPGKELVVEYETSQGEHTFELYVIADGHESNKAFSGFWVGYDTPQQVKNVTMNERLVSWDRVTSSVHGGYVDYNAIEYSVYINGELVGITSSSSLNISLLPDDPMQVYQATVVACCNGLCSKESSPSAMFVYGGPLCPPVDLEPTYPESMLFSVEDTNGDNVHWGFLSTYHAFLSGFSDVGVTNDDWLFMPPIKIESAERYYQLEFCASIFDPNYPKEYLEVCVGKDNKSTAMNTVVMPRLTPSAEMSNYSAIIKVDEPGVYYIGFHSTSAPDQGGMMLNSFKIIDDNIYGNSPAAVSNLTAVGADDGILSAEVSFTLPVTDIIGDPLPGDMKLTAVVASEIAEAYAEGYPGESITVNIATKQGINVLKVAARYGDLNGAPSNVEVYTGLVPPETPTNLRYTVSEDMHTVHLQWDPVVTGQDGGPIDPSAIEYGIHEHAYTTDGLVWTPPFLITSETFADVTIDGYTPQDVYRFGVASYNIAGTNGIVLGGADVVMGDPYLLPFSDIFTEQGRQTKPWVEYAPDDDCIAVWKEQLGRYVSQEWAYLGDVKITYAYSPKGYGYGLMGIPRVSTIDYDNVDMKLNLYVGSRCPEIEILADCYGMDEPEVIARVSGTDGSVFEEVNVTVPKSFLGKYWVNFYLKPVFSTRTQLFGITGVKIEGSIDDSGVVESLEKTNVVRVESGRGCVNIHNAQGNRCRIFNISGYTLLDKVLNENSTHVELPSGIYIIMIDNVSTHKVLVY